MTRKKTRKHKHPQAPEPACKTVEGKGQHQIHPTAPPSQPEFVCLSCGRVARVEDHLCDPAAP